MHKTLKITAGWKKKDMFFFNHLISTNWNFDSQVTFPSSSLRLTLPFNLAEVWQQVLGGCGTGVDAVVGCLLAVLDFVFLVVLSACQCEPKSQVCLCVHALWAFVLGLLQCCLPGFVVCFKVLMLVFFFPFSLCCFCPSPLPHPVHQTSACIPHARVLVLCSPCDPSSLPPHSHLFPHPPLPRPLTDPLPQSLAGTPCRTVWRRSIRQSNPESLPSGHSGDRWVTRRKGLGARRPLLIRACTSFCVAVSARLSQFHRQIRLLTFSLKYVA